jgi:hypothetical protein
MVRARLMLTGVLAGTLTLSGVAPAAALLSSSGDLLGRITDPVLAELESLDGLVDGVAEDLGTDWLDASVVDAILQTGTADDEIHDLLDYGWTEHLPAYPDSDYEPSVYKDCPNGSNKCVDLVIREMWHRYDKLGCDNAAVFSMVYALTTEEYRRAVEDPHYFRDNAFVNHQDVVFADFYFRPMDDWYQRNRIDRVPPAWRIAFDAGDRRTTSVTGDVLLGMNGHIRRDLPFVLAAIGLVTEDGETRKTDHDRVNDFLTEVQTTITDELHRRHDPSPRSEPTPYDLDEHAVMHVIRLWREEAWRKAELLVAAETDADRARVAHLIEADAAFSARSISTLLTTDDPQPRRDHCTAWRESQ